MLIKFDGTGAGGFPIGNISSVVADSGHTSGLSVDGGGTNEFNFLGGTGFLTPAVTTWSTWTRLTFTADGTNANLYANGKFQSSSVPSSTAFALHCVCIGWPWPIADFFWWQGRTLTAAQVLSHSQDPYGTTMRPKTDEWTTVGIINNGVVKKQGLLTTGVGP